MSVLLSVNNYHYRRDGSEAVYLEHNRIFESEGWTVVPFSMQHPRNLPSRWSDHFVSEIEFGHTYSFADKIRRVPKVIYSLEARAKLERLLHATRPDICHCHSIYHHISPSILGVLKRHRIPTIMTLHDLKPLCPAYHMFNEDRICEKCKGGKIYNVVAGRCVKGSLALSGIVLAESWLHRWLGSYRKNVDRFIVPCEFYIRKFEEWGWDSRQFVHVPNFVDPSAFQPAFSPGRYFVYFGRLSLGKGLFMLLEAAKLAGVQVAIAGGGPDESLLKDAAARLQADVTFLGRLEGEALHNVVRGARASVLPSVWYENAPMSILESYALGTPVIGSAIGGIPELIREGATGLLFASGSVEGLAEKLRRLAAMPDGQVAEWGRAGRRLAETTYSAAAYTDRVEALYAELMPRHSLYHGAWKGSAADRFAGTNRGINESRDGA